ncbi:LysR family transcriptional regulator [Noviherbaspirillum pedocola]|uniref:LysR family transcriptional regulator n=1 Tax=Noviherbaspirillum pedocola TaxID=2801341 RepID=A0A934T340_9BURK|nr:LysR family transcriptional regulator [Noviherbaspirillum pedocola]MBK4738539.1 LysR family transcriptional regulator [Noviherbaspirillum pedocola]
MDQIYLFYSCIQPMNIYRVDLNLLAVFHAVLETRSVTAAAQRFGITQPAMSNALARLRELLGDPLFVHTAGGMQPTPYALQVAGPIADALAGFQQAVSQRSGFNPAQSDEVFRMHITDMGQINIVPSLLEQMQRIAPRLSLDVAPFSLEEIRSRLDDGRISFSLGHLPHLKGRHIHSEKLFEERYVILMRRSHPAGEALTAHTYWRLPHVVVTSVGGGHHVVEELLVNKGARIIGRLPNIMAIALTVARTDLIATIPRRVANELARTNSLKVCLLPIKLPPFEVRLFWHERTQHNPANVWMRRQLVDLFALGNENL